MLIESIRKEAAHLLLLRRPTSAKQQVRPNGADESATCWLRGAAATLRYLRRQRQLICPGGAQVSAAVMACQQDINRIAR